MRRDPAPMGEGIQKWGLGLHRGVSLRFVWCGKILSILMRRMERR